MESLTDKGETIIEINTACADSHRRRHWKDVSKRGLTIITAHSGCEGTAPNSMAHIQSAILSGAEIIEVDVRLVDSTLLLSHNPPANPKACVTLDECFRTLSAVPDLTVNCDVKIPGLVPSVLKTAEKYGMARRIFFTGEANSELETTRAQGSGMWFSVDPYCTQQDEVRQAIDFCHENRCPYVNLHYSLVLPEVNRELKAAGMGFSVWTVDEESDIRRMLEYGVGNITTQKPTLALRLRDEIQGTMESPRVFPVQAVCGLLREAGKVLQNAGGEIVVQQKGSVDFLTQYDLQIQKQLKAELQSIFPAAVFYAEEDASSDRQTGEMTIYLDPIDGTSNFIHGFQCSAISVGVFKAGIPLFGAVYQPYSGEMFWAQNGSGAFLNGQPIRVSDRKQDTALTIFGTSSYSKDTLGRATLAIATEMFFHTADLRRCGCASLEMCYVACGRAEGFFELSLSPWDYAASALIAAEAGAQVSDMQGASLEYSSASSVICTNREIYDDTLAICQKCLRETVSSKRRI